jgi:hypothetical protein
MNADDILRSGLHDLADEVAEFADLHRVAVQRGRRRRSVRRATAAGSAVLSVAAVAGVGVVVADNAGGDHRVVQTGDSGTQKVIADPWWEAWPQNRHDGPVDSTFDNYVITHTQAESVVPILYAAGTEPDGTDWAMYLADHDQLFWMQGWNGQPDYGQEPPGADPGMTWTSWTTPTRAAHDSDTNDQQWLIIVGRPGTTQIAYSADGTTWTPLDVQDGIAVTLIEHGFPPATAQVRLSDASGVYAQGVPEGAGADVEPSTSPTPPGLSTPLATPTTP